MTDVLDSPRYVSLDQVRQEATEIDLDRQVRGYTDYIVDSIEQRLPGLGLSGRVLVNGSTSLSRRTYVVDPKQDYNQFPPDIDLAIIIDRGTFEKDIGQRLFGPFLRRPHTHNDETHGKTIVTMGLGNFYLSARIYPKSQSQENGEFNYDDTLSEHFDDDVRGEVKTLRLILMRSGMYASWNRGVPGLAVDELIRRFGSVENSFDYIGEHIRNGKRPGLVIEETGSDLLRGVSSNVWKRGLMMLERLESEGTLPGVPFDDVEWAKYFDWYKEREGIERFEMDVGIACSPCSCGREPVEIVRDVRNIAQEIFGNNKKSGLDYYVVPCGGRDLDAPHTSIYASVNLPDNYRVRRMVNKFRKKTKKTQGASESDEDYLKRLSPKRKTVLHARLTNDIKGRSKTNRKFKKRK